MLHRRHATRHGFVTRFAAGPQVATLGFWTAKRPAPCPPYPPRRRRRPNRVYKVSGAGCGERPRFGGVVSRPAVVFRSEVHPSGGREPTPPLRAGVGVGAEGCEQYSSSTFIGHRAVIGVPIVVRPSRRPEDGSQEEPQTFRIDLGMRVVGANDLGGSLCSGPEPARPRDDRCPGIGAQIGQLTRAAGGDKPDDLLTGEWVRQNSGTDHRRLNTAIGPERADHAQPVILGRHFSEAGKINHPLTIPFDESRKAVITAV